MRVTFRRYCQKRSGCQSQNELRRIWQERKPRRLRRRSTRVLARVFRFALVSLRDRGDAESLTQDQWKKLQAERPVPAGGARLSTVDPVLARGRAACTDAIRLELQASWNVVSGFLECCIRARPQQKQVQAERDCCRLRRLRLHGAINRKQDILHGGSIQGGRRVTRQFFQQAEVLCESLDRPAAPLPPDASQLNQIIRSGQSDKQPPVLLQDAPEFSRGSCGR